ncbi:hypothetical protein Nisw_08935 [Candidatus Nitrosopumilus sp. SW]|uniref:archaellin/type IV pilin N-terminal domain-containing protein n=1 Tax=Candidatus Nitrosopumilus sp. SW TaxID=2508726 RepID=UPI0011529B25|nr:archaellin/type IV pilin N-terminal domain-containing protein [Candidatus Nitrosopumilus sp. SW]QDI89636.1 hypothetical protein Nisw_08935 [Candidatus Nitrosopumilus sp. SW]
MSKQNKLTSRKAVAPVIATLLLVAIAVVGGSIVFVFSQGFFSSAQISGAPQIESLEFAGYDSRDIDILQYHDGQSSGVASGAANNGLIPNERVMVYVQNQGVSKVTLTEVRLAGTVYTYEAPAGGVLTVFSAGTGVLDDGELDAGEFWIGTRTVSGAAAEISTTQSAEIQPGQTATIILELDETLREGRDAQIKLTTANGAVFVGTVIAGQQSG